MSSTLATELTDELAAAVERLMPQLTSHCPPTRDELAALLASPCSYLLLARHPENGPIVGMATLIVYILPTGLRARLEDVVVDESARGLGQGEALTQRALELAAEDGAESVALSSGPQREAANRLYQKMGFVPWESNHYRYWLRKSGG